MTTLEPGPAGDDADSAAFTGSARPSRRGPVAIMLAMVAVLAVGLASARLTTPDEVPVAVVPPAPSASASSVVPPAPSASASPVVPSASPVRATPGPVVSPPPRDPTAVPRSTEAPIAAAAGAQRLTPVGLDAALVTVTLPDGWARVGDGVVVKAAGVPPGGMSIGVWRLGAVPTFPCRWAGSVVAPAPQLATAAGQAQALSEWWGQVPGGWPKTNAPIAPLATRPYPTTIAGLDAVAVEVLVVRDFDFDQCDGGQLVLWEAADGQARTGAGQGEVHRLWVVDVGGTILTIDAASFHGTTPADQAELQSVLDSLVIGA